MISSKFNNQQARQTEKLMRLVAAAMLCMLALNLITGAVSHLRTGTISDEPATITTKTGGDSQFPQMLAETAAAFAAGQYSSATNVVSASLLQNQQTRPAVRLGNENIIPPRWSGDWTNFGMFSSNVLRYSEPFNSIKADWQAEVPVGTALEVDVRASRDGQSWTLWQVLDQNGQVASFDSDKLFLYTEYRVRLFSTQDGLSPSFSGINLAANSRNLSTFSQKPLMEANAAPQSASPTFKIFGTREGMVGGRTANGHIIQERDHFVSLPSWTALNDYGKNDYQVLIVAPNGNSAIAPVWDCGPWNFKDNYWHNPRYEFKDLPVGVPQAEKAYFEKHNGGKNESGQGIYNPSGIDVGDGTWWDDLKLQGASWNDRLAVTFIWEGSTPSAAQISGVAANNVGSGTATIQWTTSTPTNDWVEFGFDGNYGFQTTPGKSMSTTHTVFLQDLAPNRTYNFRVRGKDIYGQDAVSQNFTFQTGSGMATLLSTWQNDPGIGVSVSPDFKSVKVAGGRLHSTYWGTTPSDDYSSGASTIDGNVGNAGGLDVELVPDCDQNGQNCSFGFGSGYKGYVQLMNNAGENVKVGLVHDVSVSPSALTVMVEGQTKSGPVTRYLQPDMLANSQSHHLHLVWMNNQLYVKVDYTIVLDPIPVTTSGVKMVFAGAARYKDDVTVFNFKEINFSWGSVVPPPA